MSGLGYGQIDLIKKIVKSNYAVDPEQAKFQWNDILFIIQELLDEDGKKYFEKDDTVSHERYKVFKQFVLQLVYRNAANYDTMLLLEGDKGTGKSSAAIMLARMWCKLIDIKFDPDRHIAYSNADVMNKIDKLNKYEPLICVTGTTSVIIKDKNDNNKLKYVKINTLVNKNNFEILSYDKDNDEFEFIEPKACVQTSKQAETFEVELMNGYKIRATEEHQFLTKRGYVCLKDLKDSDEIIIYSKKCNVCNKDFIPKNELSLSCSKKCSYTYFLNSRRGNEKVIAYAKKYRDNNKALLKIKRDEYVKKNKPLIKQRKKLEVQRNKASYIKRRKKYWEENKEILKIKNKKYRLENKNLIREYKRKRHKFDINNNPEYKIKRNLRRRLNLAIKCQKGNKQKSMENYLGCTIKQFKVYLESKFDSKMNFSNYGKWHIDHIKPCSSFNLVNLEEQKKCFHYTNLQPLWAKDNLSKGAKYDN